MVFGVPFLAAGVFALLTTFGILPLGKANGTATANRPVVSLMGVVFTAVGTVFVFGRSRTTLDLLRRTVSQEWSLGVPVRARIHPLDAYTAVTLDFVKGDSDTADSFAIGLKAREGPDLGICSFTTYAQSLDCAVAVARHLQVDLEDNPTARIIRVASTDLTR
jgi:hypothetical protein